MKRPTWPGPQVRVLVRDRPTMTLRIETGTAVRGGDNLPSFATVEWAGHLGHPSSYALLGGSRSRVPRTTVFQSGALYREALAARSDKVRWGLPPEYEQAVMDVIATQPIAITVGSAAHGELGSSEHAFKAVALLLCRILAQGVPPHDADIWKLRDRCWNEVSAK